ncbi:hypothetical protein RvVAR0630_21940 [Agrobacterium vitis]|nr:hypothetical protein RvVAR0630_21940 [Agrobacterium vitis]
MPLIVTVSGMCHYGTGRKADDLKALLLVPVVLWMTIAAQGIMRKSGEICRNSVRMAGKTGQMGAGTG